MNCPRLNFSPRPASRRGFTLVEVLAAMLLVAIVLPAVMQAISTATRAASAARARTEAASLASGKLAEIVATDAWETGGTLSGDFAPEFPGYRWAVETVPWAGDDTGASLTELDLTVTWHGPLKDESIKLSTLARSTAQ